MTTETPATKAPRAKGDKGRRLTIVFDGKFASLFQQIEKVALAEDRDMDTTVLRALNQAFNPSVNS